MLTSDAKNVHKKVLNSVNSRRFGNNPFISRMLQPLGQNQTFTVLPPPQALRFSRKAGEGGELEAREPGDEHVWEQGRKRGLTASLSLIKLSGG